MTKVGFNYNIHARVQLVNDSYLVNRYASNENQYLSLLNTKNSVSRAGLRLERSESATLFTQINLEEISKGESKD